MADTSKEKDDLKTPIVEQVVEKKKDEEKKEETIKEGSGNVVVPEVKEVKVDEQPKKTGHFLRGCILVLGAIAIFIIFGVIIGAWGWPRISKWLVNHNFIKGNVTQVVDNSGNVVENRVVTITSEENVVTNVVKASQDSVVSIAVAQSSVQPGQGVVSQDSNIGSGFIVDKNGLILTNQHVVADTTLTYKVITNKGVEYSVQKIYRDDINDIALIKIDASDLKPLKLGNSDNLTQGQFVIAIGTPLGEYAGSVTTGVISGLNRSVTAQEGFLGNAKVYEDVIQTDAAINPGNSGGPLFNSSGEVIGINFATTSGANNISFALPINRASVKLAEYIKYGKFITPYIGVEYLIITELDAKYYSDVVPGAYIKSVAPSSPAATAGLKAADIITQINGQAITNSLSTVLQKFKVGDEVTLKVWRAGKTVDIKLTIGDAG